MVSKFKEIYSKYKEIVLYLFWGTMTTIVNWLTYIIFVRLFQLDIVVSNGGAWIIAVLFAYITNQKFVFESHAVVLQEKLKEILKFFMARIATGLIEIVGMPILYYVGLDMSIIGIDGLAAKIIVSVVVIVLNYVFSKLLVFK